LVAGQIGRQARRHEQVAEGVVAVAVVPDLVPAGDQRPHDIEVARDLGADAKERAARLLLLEQARDPRGELGMRTVVEGERDLGAIARAVPEGRTEQGGVRVKDPQAQRRRTGGAQPQRQLDHPTPLRPERRRP
jgi:hypothetical protein